MSWILVVDDEPHVTRLTRTRLERAGHQVEVASNGEDALERMAARHFDALVTDVCMPKMDGRELCEAVRKHSQNHEPFILMVTSSAEEDLHRWAEEIPNLEFMEKPVSLIRLVARIDAVLGHGTQEPR